MKQYNIYKTTNLINKKFYWGVHNSVDENDGYLGSGKALSEAIKKYGKENFKRETKLLYDTKKEAYKDEKLIVNQKMINYSMCYNEKLGGYGGWEHIDNRGENHPMFGVKRPEISTRMKGENNPSFGGLSEDHKKKISKTRIEKGLSKGKKHPMYGKTGENNPNFGSKRTETTKQRMSGENNSMSLSNREKRRLKTLKQKCNNTGNCKKEENKA